MIERHPDVPDHFLVLERKESFGDYARAYGDALAEHYENRGVIVVPFMPIAFDADLIQTLVFPRAWKKLGTANGIERPLVTRQDGRLVLDASHPFAGRFPDDKVASYVQAQIAKFNAQLRHGLSMLFPRYYSLAQGNITWRLLETVEEGLHLDVFGGGTPLDERTKSTLRVKIFINIDTEPRRWRTSLDLPAVLKAGRGRLPDELPADVNVVNGVIDKFGVLKPLPAHQLAFPSMSAVLVNAEVVAHEVVYGRRMVGAEFGCEQRDMLHPDRISHARVRNWLQESGYTVAADAATVAARYAHMKGSYQLVQEARARASA